MQKSGVQGVSIKGGWARRLTSPFACHFVSVSRANRHCFGSFLKEQPTAPVRWRLQHQHFSHVDKLCLTSAACSFKKNQNSSYSQHS